MSSAAVKQLFRVQRRIFQGVCVIPNRVYCICSKAPYKQRKVSLEQQSVLLPGPERIRSSQLLDNPTELLAKIPGSPNLQTVFEVLDHGLRVSGDGDCIGTKLPDGTYRWLTYSKVISKAQHIGSGLIALGLKPQNSTFVGIFAANREEFLLTLYACSAFSMVSVPLYLSFSLPSLLLVVQQANLPLVIANSLENAEKLVGNSNKLPALQTVVVLEQPNPALIHMAKSQNVRLLTFADLEILGRTSPNPLVLPKPTDLFCIPYTSGTTGTPKGVMLTHNNMISCVAALVVGYGDAGVFGGTIMSYLPPAHIYEIANEVASLYFARRIAFYSGDIKKLMDEVRVLRPHILPLVPRLMNIIYRNVMDSMKGSYLKSLIFRIALKGKENLLKKGKVTNQSIWDRLVFKKFQEVLGGNVNMIITTSAPISPEVMRFFRYASGASVFEAYGQTEMLAATMTLPLEQDGGFVGPPLPCNYIKLADVPDMGYFSKDDIGEVCIKGENIFLGYFKNEEANTLVDGWQHTGDIGKWLPNGCLKIVDRKKHLFKLSQGEYIAPEKVENVYGKSKLVLQILVDGFTDKDYIVALVVPEPTNLQSWLKSKGYEDTDLSNKELRKEFLKELRALGAQEELTSLEQARNITLLSEQFSYENDLLTPTLKVKRKQASKHLEGTIRSLYEEGPLL